jgi:hypothetical protein
MGANPTIPNTFAPLTGQVQLSLLDGNFTALTNYLSSPDNRVVVGVDSGSANSYVITTTQILSAYNFGTLVSFSPVNTNTSSCTINISGVSTVALSKLKGGAIAPLVSGDIVAGLPAIVQCTGSQWILINPAAGFGALPLNYITGLTLNNNGTNPTYAIDVATGTARSDDNTADIALNSALTGKSLNATWASGSSAGMLDTGTKGSSTTYHIFAILNPTNGNVDILASLSVSSPTFPTGFTKKRRIGSILTDGSSNIRAFIQSGKRFMLSNNIVELAFVSGSTTPATITCSALPNGINVIGIFAASLQWTGGSGTLSAAFYDPALGDGTQPGLILAGPGQFDAAQVQSRVSTSRGLRWVSSANGNGVSLSTQGWDDYAL